MMLQATIFSSLCLAVYAGSLADIEHVVLYMQENRAFDHYFGTLYGVRGFLDPNVHIAADTNLPVYYQKVNATLTKQAEHLLPYYINHDAASVPNRTIATQCTEGGSNGWSWNVASYAAGANNMFALANSPFGLGYFKRPDVPVQFALADEFLVGDNYQQGVISSTNPNRVMWQSGSINVPGGPIDPSMGGPVLDNNVEPGCDSLTYNVPTSYDAALPEVGAYLSNASYINLTSAEAYACFPYKWKTTPEYLEDIGASWNVWQGRDNFGDNGLLSFEKYILYSVSDGVENPLVGQGLQFQPYPNSTNQPQNIINQLYPAWDNVDELGGADAFIAAAMNDSLPAVSYIIGPGELSEHPPYSPQAGGWFTKRIVEGLMNSPAWNKTALLISYDETGGLWDHVVPFTSPPGTAGEWITNPFSGESVPSGPGFRMPFFIVSPWTRNGAVFTEPADHTSQILFLEAWLAAKGKPFHTAEINSWRREHMSNLVNAFDFNNPDFSLPNLPDAAEPHSTNGVYDDAEYCEALYLPTEIFPKIPYGNQSMNDVQIEPGFRPVRGHLTEGRYLVWESNSAALAYANSTTPSTTTAQAQKQTDPNQRLILYAQNSKQADVPVFKIAFATALASNSTAYFSSDAKLVASDAASFFNVSYDAASGTHSAQDTTSGQFLSFANNAVSPSQTRFGFKVYSVTF